MNDASKLAVGQAHYSAMLYPNGTFVDDVVVHKLSDNDYLHRHQRRHPREGHPVGAQTIGHMPGVHINDYSDYYTQLAIQGPRAAETLQKLTNVDLSTIKNYWFTWGQVCGLHNVMIARTGYTGEDGFEIYIPSDEATSARVWNEVLEAGQEFGIVPCGLGARNTLRLESAMALYGHEISDTINVFEAEPRPLRQARQAQLRRPRRPARHSGGRRPERKLVGLEMVERGIARDGYPVAARRRHPHRPRHQRLARALPQEEHRHGAGRINRIRPTTPPAPSSPSRSATSSSRPSSSPCPSTSAPRRPHQPHNT